jgi:hypothetical protein
MATRLPGREPRRQGSRRAKPTQVAWARGQRGCDIVQCEACQQRAVAEAGQCLDRISGCPCLCCLCCMGLSVRSLCSSCSGHFRSAEYGDMNCWYFSCVFGHDCVRFWPQSLILLAQSCCRGGPFLTSKRRFAYLPQAKIIIRRTDDSMKRLRFGRSPFSSDEDSSGSEEEGFFAPPPFLVNRRMGDFICLQRCAGVRVTILFLLY